MLNECVLVLAKSFVKIFPWISFCFQMSSFNVGCITQATEEDLSGLYCSFSCKWCNFYEKNFRILEEGYRNHLKFRVSFCLLTADRDRRLSSRIPRGAAATGDHVLDYDSMHSSNQMRGMYSSAGVATLGSRKMSSRDKDAFQLPESSRSPSRHQRITK